MRLGPFIFSIGLALLSLSAELSAQTAEERRPTNPRPTQPDSDAGRPSGPLIPPGRIDPLSGDGIQPLSSDYLGEAPDPTKQGFQNPPGHLPRGQLSPNNDPRRQHRPDREPRGTPLPNSGVVVTLPPASTGRQGLPPQTWAMLTAYQQDLHRQAETAAIASALGEGFVWDDAGRHGEVRVIADRMHNNRPCRDFAHVVLIDGQRIDGVTTICR